MLLVSRLGLPSFVAEVASLVVAEAPNTPLASKTDEGALSKSIGPLDFGERGEEAKRGKEER